MTRLRSAAQATSDVSTLSIKTRPVDGLRKFWRRRSRVDLPLRRKVRSDYFVGDFFVGERTIPSSSSTYKDALARTNRQGNVLKSPPPNVGCLVAWEREIGTAGRQSAGFCGLTMADEAIVHPYSEDCHHQYVLV
ncbi:hypothetical protein G6O67_001847 [Ophiocordyceps sinensis]|uniref:Uncharacterized protein n=1 Tax=Ophiocordyceps sinensis TaxID=72228 RepID=A0A8H4V6N3_9HYPO|nr:hypothetical protein G6O67_001847 [Ophiocordyceps sinensis]